MPLSAEDFYRNRNYYIGRGMHIGPLSRSFADFITYCYEIRDRFSGGRLRERIEKAFLEEDLCYLEELYNEAKFGANDLSALFETWFLENEDEQITDTNEF